jgi:hypothetical protein
MLVLNWWYWPNPDINYIAGGDEWSVFSILVKQVLLGLKSLSGV